MTLHKRDLDIVNKNGQFQVELMGGNLKKSIQDTVQDKPGGRDSENVLSMTASPDLVVV